MRRIPALAACLQIALVAALVAVAGCGGGEEKHEAPASEASVGQAPPVRGIQRVRLDNGVTVYMEEEHSDDQVAIEVFYRAGYPDEPAGQAQVAHMAEHAHVHGAVAGAPADSLFRWINDRGQSSAQVAGPVTHIDYFVPADRIADVLRAEAARLTSLRVEPEMLREEAERATREIRRLTEKGSASMHVYGEAAFHQVLRHGARHVDVLGAPARLDADAVAAFHRAHYVPHDMVVVIAGGFDSAKAVEAVRDILGAIPDRPSPAVAAPTLERDVRATWDLPVRAVYVTWPDTVASYADRLALTIYSSYVRHRIITDADLAEKVDRVYASNPVAPVGAEPFFVYAQPTPTTSTEDVVEAIARVVRETRQSIDADRYASIRANARRFLEATLLDKAAGLPVRQQYLGQEAMNTAFKHFYTEGMEPDDFMATLDAISFEDFLAVLDRYLAPERRRVVVFTPRAAAP